MKQKHLKPITQRDNNHANNRPREAQNSTRTQINTDSTTRYVENVEQETHQEQKNAEDVKARTSDQRSTKQSKTYNTHSITQ